MSAFIQLCKAFGRGFVGGPDTRQNQEFSFIFEDKQLEIILPESNVFLPNATPETPETVPKYYPHTSIEWFVKNAQIIKQHFFVEVLAKEWMYFPPISLLPSSEYGLFACQLRLKQVDRVNVQDPLALGRFLTQAFDDYQNGPKGLNTTYRKWVRDDLNRSGIEWSLQEKEAAIEEESNELIALKGCDPLAPAKTLSINGLTWVFYREQYNNDPAHTDFYCLPLSEQSFIEVRFNYRTDIPDKFKKWQPHAAAAQERIMQSIRLFDAPISQDPVLTDATDK